MSDTPKQQICSLCGGTREKPRMIYNYWGKAGRPCASDFHYQPESAPSEHGGIPLPPLKVRPPFPVTGQYAGPNEYAPSPSASVPGESGKREPDGYAYRYPDGIRFGTNGYDVNGCAPVEIIPYYFAAPPLPQSEQELIAALNELTLAVSRFFGKHTSKSDWSSKKRELRHVAKQAESVLSKVRAK